MLATALIWLYTFLLCYVYGFIFLRLVQRFWYGEAELTAFPLVVVTGLIILTTLASFFSLFFQIGLVFNLLLAAGALWALLGLHIPLPRLPGRWTALTLILLAAALLIVLENATHRPLNPDTNIYHAQAIHWIESYPAVPGLGNLHGRLAFNSAWFVSNALFSFSFLGLRSFHLTASVLFLAVLLYFLDGFGALAQGERKPSALLKVLFFPLMFFLLAVELSSPGTDLPVSLLLWLVAVLWAEYCERQGCQPLLIVLLAAFALTIKLSAAPVLLLALLVLGETLWKGQKHQFAGMAACAVLVLLPFLARNLILSGYLFYPLPSIDLFSFDWKVPLERAAGEQLSIRAWARFPRLDAARVLAMPFVEWFPQWLADQTLNRRLTLFAALLSLPVAAAGLWTKTPARRYWPGWLVFYLGALFWLFNAPDFRFGYGFLIPAILLALVPWGELASARAALSAAKVSTVVSVLVIGYLGFTLAASFEARTFAGRLLLPADYDRVSTQSCALANGSVFCAKAYNACSYDAFPCIPGARPWVELRGATFRDGFRAVP